MHIAQYPNPKPELFGQTRPEPDPKSKSPTRQSLIFISHWPREKKQSYIIIWIEGAIWFGLNDLFSSLFPDNSWCPYQLSLSPLGTHISGNLSVIPFWVSFMCKIEFMFDNLKCDICVLILSLSEKSWCFESVEVFFYNLTKLKADVCSQVFHTILIILILWQTNSLKWYVPYTIKPLHKW